MTKRYHYTVLSVKPTRKASDIQTLLNAAADKGYRLLKIKGEAGEVYKDEDINQLVISDLYFFERESEKTAITTFANEDDVYTRLAWPLFQQGKWDEIDKLVDYIAISKGFKRAESFQETIEWLKKRHQVNELKDDETS